MKSVIRSIKNEINNYDEGERLVREITSNERAPPSREMLTQLQLMLGDRNQFETIVKMLFKRLRDYNSIRHVEKSLICIEFLLKNADRKFVRYCQMDKKSIQKLTRYRYILGNNNGVPVDYGGGVRKRAKRIVDLLETEEKLKEERAKAQGHYMDPDLYNTDSSKGGGSSSKKKSKSTSSSQKKKKSKKKKTKKKKSDDPNSLKEPQYDSFFEVPADNGVKQTTESQPKPPQQPSGDLLSGDWWQQGQQQDDEDPFGTGQEDDEFGWFQSGDLQNNAEESGVGEDGGAFGFGNEEDFEDDKKEEEAEDLDADAWMSTLTQMDNVLDGSVQKKDPNKRNLKGKSMRDMAANNPIPSSFGTDDFFNSNSGGNGLNGGNESNDFDPFGMNGTSTTTTNMINGNASNITSLYGNSSGQGQPNLFGNNTMNNTTFGYTGKGMSSVYNTDPFAGIGSGSGGPQPANYVPRKKAHDPFAQFGNMK